MIHSKKQQREEEKKERKKKKTHCRKNLSVKIPSFSFCLPLLKCYTGKLKERRKTVNFS